MVAMAKTHMRPDARLYATAKYERSDEERYISAKAVYRLLYQKVYMPRELGGSGIALKHDMPASIIQGLCEISLSEDMWSNKCPTCKGKGDAYVPNYVICDNCGGSGNRRYTQKRIAGAIGCTERWYRNKWAGPHGDIKKVLQDWDRDVWIAVSRLNSSVVEELGQIAADSETVWGRTIDTLMRN